ncbi:DUF222 domain-containing protein [Aeromicrobium sp. CTD01-1L150]|uniref:HNH endonuclease signature motif containing protein n=1 Tax=Aeromicrobium sp. CTD01-1L150 TaxID=3341830 RepID=UPI0035C11473
MDVDTVTSPERLTALTRAQAQAEAAVWSAMLCYRDAELARIDALGSSLQQATERAGLVLEIAQAVGLSEAQTYARLAVADRGRECAPATWLAFCAGRIDGVRVRDISRTLDRLERAESWLRLDQTVVAYAECHTPAELRAWLRRFVTRVEADLALQRAEAEREHRTVEVTHGDDGMSWVNAYLPSHAAAAIATRLRREAKALGANDDRTRGQRMADLFTCWLTTNQATETATVADIAVVLEADALTGSVDGFAEAADGSWAVPASWILHKITTDDGVAFWHRMLKDPITHDVLAHEYVGRFSPEILTKAIAFRDGICRAPGCMKPADECDADHREPWPAGETSGRNIWPLCRRHHTLKGHQVLRWVLPSGTTIPADTTQHHIRPEPPSQVEHTLAQLTIKHSRD